MDETPTYADVKDEIRRRLLERYERIGKLENAIMDLLHEWNDFYDGPGYFPSSFVAAIIRLRRALEASANKP